MTPYNIYIILCRGHEVLTEKFGQLSTIVTKFFSTLKEVQPDSTGSLMLYGFLRAVIVRQYGRVLRAVRQEEVLNHEWDCTTDKAAVRVFERRGSTI